MRSVIAVVVAGYLAFGCSSNTSKTNVTVNQIPAAVQGAFYTEHPYAQMNHPQKVTDADGSVSYLIPYTRPDGTTGKVTYAPTGEEQSGQ
jgi:hypothetical protein